MLAHPQLPYGIIDRCLDVLKEIMPSERDLIRLIVEIIVELREGDEPEGDHQDEPPVSPSALHVIPKTDPLRYLTTHRMALYFGRRLFEKPSLDKI